MTPLKQSPVKELTELETIREILCSNNDKLISTIYDLEAIGHKVKNTNVPPLDSNKEQLPKSEQQSDGLLHEIRIKLGYYEAHNLRLREFLLKLDQFI